MSLLALVVGSCISSGCSGGGASGVPQTSVAPSTGSGKESVAGLTSYAVSSLPAGLAVMVATHAATTGMTTPATVTPAASNFQTTISIVPSNGAPVYAVAVDQHDDGKHAIYYDQHADTAGSMTTGASASNTARRPASSTRELTIGPLGSIGRPAYAADDVIVRYRANASPGDVERALGVLRALPLRTAADGTQTRVLDVPPETTVASFARALGERADVLSVEGDALYHEQTVLAVAPNDPHFDPVQQWDMFDVGAPFAWGYAEGSPAVAIAMIDTGVDTTSPDFAGGKVQFAESIIAGTVTTGIAAVQDTDGHGTNTAGIAAAGTNDAFGFAGAGFNVGLQIYKVFPDGTAANGYASDARSSDVTRAIDAAVAHGVRVVNLSLGSCQVEGVDSAQRAAIDAALAAGVVVVAAAGNERSGSGAATDCAGGSSTLDFPAGYAGVISVGATSLDDSGAPLDPALATEYVASYSNAGPGLTLVAPGGDPSAAELAHTTSPDPLHWIDNLYTTTAANPNERCADTSDCTALFSGTSQATPHVAAAAALMLSENPALTPARIEQMLIASADDIGDPRQGNGRLDMYRALAAAAGDPIPPERPWNANFVAIAYVPGGTNRPQIVDVTYPAGVAVASDGTFRIADVPPGGPSFKIGVWYDANGDGRVDAGDYFGTSQTCPAAAPCSGASGGIVARPVPAGFVLN